MAIVLKPPQPLELDPALPSVFLAGSIAMGEAEPWQAQVEAALSASRLQILNPRRAAWDASWAQAADNPEFAGQVTWELDAQAQASLIAMYFAPPTQAPVTLLELGLFARSGKLVVCCPAGFWRKGNVDMVCERYGIPTVPSLAGLIRYIADHFGLPDPLAGPLGLAGPP